MMVNTDAVADKIARVHWTRVGTSGTIVPARNITLAADPTTRE